MSLPVITPADVYVDPRTVPIPRHFEYTYSAPNSFAVVLGRGARRRHPELFSTETFASPLTQYPCPQLSDLENPCPGVYASDAAGVAGEPQPGEGCDEDDDEDDTGNVVDYLSEQPKAPQLPSPLPAAPALSAWRSVLEHHLGAAGLGPADIEAFFGELHVARFTRGDVVLKRGAVGDRAFIVVSGSVDVLQGALGSSDCVCVAQLHSGDSFGFVSLVAMQKWSVSVVVSSVEGCECRFIDRFDFAPLAVRKPLLLIALHTLMAEAVSPELNYSCRLRSVVLPVPGPVKDTPHTSIRGMGIAATRLGVDSSLREAAAPALQLATKGLAAQALSSAQQQQPLNLLIAPPVFKRGSRFAPPPASTGPSYAITKQLGAGAHGKVVLCQEVPGSDSATAGCLFAVKVINKAKMRCKASALGVEAMTSLRHPNIVSLVRVIDDDASGCLYFVQEFCDLGCVMGEAVSSKPLAIDVAREYFRGVLKGLEYLHGQGIIHRDIKPSNILLKSPVPTAVSLRHPTAPAAARSVLLPGVAKLADFGLSALLPASARGSAALLSNVDSTPAFMAPEMFALHSDKPLLLNGAAADMWSLGATLYNMVVGRPPFLETSRERLAALLASESAPEWPPTLPPLLINIIGRMLDKNADTRATLEEVMRHPWVTARGTDPLPMTLYPSVVHSTGSAQELAGAARHAPSPSGEMQPASTAASGPPTRAAPPTTQSPLSSQPPLHLPRSASPDTPTLPPTARHGLLRRHARFTARALSSAASISPNISSGDYSPGFPGPASVPVETHGALDRASHNASVARIMTRVDDSAIPIDASVYEGAEVCGGAAAAPTEVDVSPTALAPAAVADGRSSREHAQARQLAALLSALKQWRAVPLVPPEDEHFFRDGILTSETRGSSGPADGSDASPLSPQPGALTPRVWWPSRPLAVGVPADSSVLTSSAGASFLRPGGSSPSAATDEFPGLSMRVLDSLLIREAARVAASQGAADVLQALLFDDWMRPPEEGPELNPPPARPLLGSDGISFAYDPVLDAGLLLGSDSLWDKPVDACDAGVAPAVGAAASAASGTASGSSDLSGVVETIDEAAGLDAELGGTQIRRPATDPELAPLDDVTYSAAATHGGKLTSPEAFPGPRSVSSLGKAAVSSSNNNARTLSASESDLDRELTTSDQYAPVARPGSECATLDELQQLHTLPECSSRPLRIAFGVAEDRGLLETMEDRAVAIVGLEALAADLRREASDASPPEVKRSVPFARTGLRTSRRPGGQLKVFDETQPQVLFAVYDGHGGQGCVAALASTLHQHLARQVSFFGDPTSALALAFAEADLAIVRAQAAGRAACATASGQPSCESPLPTLHVEGSDAGGGGVLKSAFSRHINVDRRGAMDSSGAVAVVALLRLENPSTFDGADAASAASLASDAGCADSRPAPHSAVAAPLTRIYLAHAGDARAVLSRHGVAIDLTRDHRAASRPDEVARVMAAGGWVRGNRVMGVLGVTRSFGDAELKGGGPDALPGIVTAEPDVRVVDVGPLDEFVVLASDGLFDVLSSQQAVNFVRRKLHEHGEVQRAATQLVQKALWSGSTDNVSAVLVALNQQWGAVQDGPGDVVLPRGSSRASGEQIR